MAAVLRHHAQAVGVRPGCVPGVAEQVLADEGVVAVPEDEDRAGDVLEWEGGRGESVPAASVPPIEEE